MKYCVIDVGSNSVRLALIVNQNTEYKKVKITRLAQNLGEGRFLCKEAIDRTLEAVCEFVKIAKREEPEQIFIFATASVRLAKNGAEFCKLVQDCCGIKVDVVSGDLEAMIGARGALGAHESGALIDIGGASTEIVVLDGDSVYKNSFPIGAVTLTERLKNRSLFDILDEEFASLPKITEKNFFAVGGTATSVVAMILSLKNYDSKLVHGYRLKLEQVFRLKTELEGKTIEEISKMDGLQKGREGTIYAGVCLLLYLFKRLKIEEIRVSERDNLEGYLEYILEKL